MKCSTCGDKTNRFYYRLISFETGGQFYKVKRRRRLLWDATVMSVYDGVDANDLVERMNELDWS